MKEEKIVKGWRFYDIHIDAMRDLTANDVDELIAVKEAWVRVSRARYDAQKELTHAINLIRGNDTMPVVKPPQDGLFRP